MIGARPLSEEEIAVLLDILPSIRDKCLFILGVRTGFRISELLSITVKDVKPYTEIVDSITVQRKSMKGKTKSRTIPLHPEAKHWLSLYITSGMSKNQRLFDIGRKHAWKLLTKAYREARLTGKLGTHCMRKSFADRVYTASGENVFTTQLALGHENPGNTVRYLSFRQEAVTKAILGVK